MNKKFCFLSFFLLPHVLLSESLSLSIAAGLSYRFNCTKIVYSDGASSYIGFGTLISTQIAWRNLPYGLFPTLNFTFQPPSSIDSSIVERAPWLRQRIIIVCAGVGKTFNVGHAKIDVIAHLGYNWQTLEDHRHGGVVSESPNDICFIVGANARSPIFDKLYTNASCKYFYQKDESINGVFEFGNSSYTLDVYNKMLFIEFGLEILL